jgi:hypothetical protein
MYYYIKTVNSFENLENENIIYEYIVNLKWNYYVPDAIIFITILHYLLIYLFVLRKLILYLNSQDYLKRQKYI